jgi:transcriptional regulator with XRE-family HTH domain
LNASHLNRTKELRHRLREARERQGLSQKLLAQRMRKPQSFISKIETGERNLDVVEFLEICEAMAIDALDMLRAVRDTCSPSFAWQPAVAVDLRAQVEPALP